MYSLIIHKFVVPVLIATSFSLACISPGLAQRSEPSSTLIELWLDANGRCRGGSGDEVRTEAACEERQRLGLRLEAMGRCYGKQGQVGAKMAWHLCTETSLRSADDPEKTSELLKAASVAASRSAFEVAFRIWEPLAKRGNAEAQFHLGIMYYFGEGVKKNFSTALFWRMKAAEQGHPAAQLDVGVMYSNGQGVRRDDRTAASWYRKSADAGNAQAQFNLARSLETGAGVNEDRDEAFRWYVRAAEQNQEDAQLAAAKTFGDPASSKYDPVKARAFYGRAAINGKSEAQLALGVIYLTGRGVAVDEVKASMWLKFAAGYLSERVTRNNGSVGQEAKQLLAPVQNRLDEKQRRAYEAAFTRCADETNMAAAVVACGLD